MLPNKQAARETIKPADLFGLTADVTVVVVVLFYCLSNSPTFGLLVAFPFVIQINANQIGAAGF